ncbi:dinucleotide-utilizing enzyme [uncultured Microbacterium sp.]|uniref:dinucleotide-utilizing enzyme n=1 Tax=uncultured Microbacterium sp. TaxID=191216 RepID=UPI0025EC7BFC|nr:dinucleotide-utilizing enzyme [uncultured Microbacterium sp.]
MQTRPRLVTSIPFWVLVVASVAAIAGGLAIVLNGIDAMEQVLNDPNATVVQVYVGQSWVVVGAAVLGAGAIGIALVLALAAATALVRRPDVAVETIDWNSDDETAPEAFGAAPYTATSTTAATSAAPLAVEDADVEVPSTAPAPPQAAAAASHDEPRLDTGDDVTRR